MYVSAVPIFVVFGMSTPAMRANRLLLALLGVLKLRLPLALLVLRVLADHPHDAFPADDLALDAKLSHRRSYFDARRLCTRRGNRLARPRGRRGSTGR